MGERRGEQLAEITSRVRATEEKTHILELKNARLIGLQARFEREKVETTKEWEVTIKKLEDELRSVRDIASAAEAKSKFAKAALEESQAQEKALGEELEELKSQRCKDNIVNEYKVSGEHTQEMENKANKYYERGCLGMLRQLHPLVDIKECLLSVFEVPFDSERCREETYFIPYTNDEFWELRYRDSQIGLPFWRPPPLLHPNFQDLLGDLDSAPVVTPCIEDIPDEPMEGTCDSPPHSPADALVQ